MSTRATREAAVITALEPIYVSPETRENVGAWLAGRGPGERAALARALIDAEEPEPGPLSGVRSLADVLADPDALAAPHAVVPGLAWAGRVSLLVGREKTGKSTLACAAAAATSAGHRFGGMAGETGPVLYVGLEEHVGDLARRLVRFGADAREIWLLDRLLGESPLTDLGNAMAEVRPALTVIDTLAAFVAPLGLEPGDSSAWTPTMLAVAQLARDYDSAILLLAHARKADGEYRDSTAIGASVDVILTMSAADLPAVRNISARGRWAIEDVSLQLVEDDGPASYFARASGETLSLDARVLAFVEDHAGTSQSAVESGVSGKAVDVRSALRRLIAAGRLVDDGNRRGHAYRALRPSPDEGPGRGRDGAGTDLGRTVPQDVGGGPSRAGLFPVGEAPGTDATSGSSNVSEEVNPPAPELGALLDVGGGDS